MRGERAAIWRSRNLGRGSAEPGPNSLAVPVTTGAIYGNFKNRDELFIAMSETYWPPNGSDVFAAADLR